MKQQKSSTKKKSVIQQVKKLPEDGKPGSIAKFFNDFRLPALIFILCFLLYGNTIGNDYAMDDMLYTTQNHYVQQGFSAITNIFNKGSLYGYNQENENYRPLVLLDFMAEVSLFGMNPHVSHFFNVLFFAITCLFLYLLFRKIFFKYNPLIAFSATLIFVFHPIHTEVVANIKSRDEILGLLFCVLSSYFIMLYAEKKKKRFYAASLITFFAALLSKENYLPYGFVIPLLLYFFTSIELKRIVRISSPYITLIVIYLIIRGSILDSVTFKDAPLVYNNSLMAAGNYADQLATNSVLLGKYIYMLFIPYPLSCDYSYNQIPIVHWANIWAIVSLLLYLATAVYIIRYIKTKAVFVFAILVYLLTLILSSNLVVKIAATFAERFLYAPSLSFCIAAPFIITKALNLKPEEKNWQNIKRNIFYVVIAVILLLYMVILIPRNKVWENDFTLFSSAAIASPNSARTHAALGYEYQHQFETATLPEKKKELSDSAIQEFTRSINIYDKVPDVYYNLGVIYTAVGMPDSAIKTYQKIISLRNDIEESIRKNNSSTSNNEPHIQSLLTLTLYAQTLNNMGSIYYDNNNIDEAFNFYQSAIQADSNLSSAFENIGRTYVRKNDFEKARYSFYRANEMSPDNAAFSVDMRYLYASIGLDFFNKKEYDKALDQFLLALKYDNSSGAYGNIALTYQVKGDKKKAIEYYQKALIVDSNNKAFTQSLATLKAIK
jgi:protein O-mannosyl-transferase